MAGRPRGLRTARHGLPATDPRGGGRRRYCPGRGAARAGQQGGNTMIWVSWRQHRSQAIACLALLAALAVYAIVVGSSMRTAFGQNLVTCLARSQGTGCPDAIQAFTG